MTKEEVIGLFAIGVAVALAGYVIVFVVKSMILGMW